MSRKCPAKLPSFERLKQVIDYDPETGIFRWVEVGKMRRPGDAAGSVSSHGYWLVGIDGTNHYGHRLAYLFMTGEEPATRIDHINLDTLNNRWSNLRLATAAQNAANSKRRKDNSTGFRGVYRLKGRFAAKIIVGGKQIHLGTFSDPAEAGAAYHVAAQRYFGEFARAA
jgi:hypothetical protein